MPEIFENYLVVQRKEKTMIKGRIVFQGLEKIGYPMFYLLPVAILFYLPLHIVLKVILIAVTMFVLLRYLKYLLSRTILTLNTEKKQLKSDLDGFTTILSDVKDITIIEETSQDGIKVYLLQFILPEGEKTAPFAFTSYNNLQEIIALIRPQTPEN